MSLPSMQLGSSERVAAVWATAGPATAGEGARLVRVDRAAPAGLAALTGEYDAVVDVARVPSQVRAALRELAGRVGHWSFVSSCSAYADQATPGQRADSAPLLEPEPGLDD